MVLGLILVLMVLLPWLVSMLDTDHKISIIQLVSETTLFREMVITLVVALVVVHIDLVAIMVVVVLSPVNCVAELVMELKLAGLCPIFRRILHLVLLNVNTVAGLTIL